MSQSSHDFLDPPLAPFARNGTGSRASSPVSRPTSSDPLSASSGTMHKSLSINYLPSKFSSSMLVRKRKRGGGVSAFKSGESRMPGEGDVDYDGVDTLHGAKRSMRWTPFKWALIVSNTLLTAYALATLLLLLLTWFDVFPVVRYSNHTELVLSTFTASLALLTSMLGWAGILLNNRSFLAVYTLLLWVVLGFVLAPGYVTYKRRHLNLEGKLNLQWSRALSPSSRLVIQNHLGCCGYYSPFVEATSSSACYARSVLPGCKRAYMAFQRHVLGWWYTAAFVCAGTQIIVVIVGVLSSNHVTWRFGKGMMPEAYRLSEGTVGAIREGYRKEIGERYGVDLPGEGSASSSSRGRTMDKSESIQMKPMPLANPTTGAGDGLSLGHDLGYEGVRARSPE